MPFADNQRQLSVVLPRAAYRALKTLAKQERCTIAAHARTVLLRDLERHGVVVPPQAMPKPHHPPGAMPPSPPSPSEEPLELSASSPEVQAALRTTMRAATAKRLRRVQKTLAASLVAVNAELSPTSPAPLSPSAAEIAAMLAAQYAGDEEIGP
jgi:hypothetical protein